MKKKINGLNINYKKYGKHDKCVVLLHGWGQNISMMEHVALFLKEHFTVYNLDLPGFGESDEPLSTWGVEDYADFLNDFLSSFNVSNPIIIGHSFGCRIAIRYAYKYGAYKMCLTGAAGVRDKRTIKWYIKTYTYKLGKRIAKLLNKDVTSLANKVGSEDYKNASGIMKSTFVKVVNDDVTPILKDINVETLLVFGTNDKATPISKGKLMEKLMPNAVLVEFENDDHYAYFNEPVRFNNVLDAFLRSDYD